MYSCKLITSRILTASDMYIHTDHFLITVKFLDKVILSSCISTAVLSNDPVQILGSMGKDEGKLMYPCSLKIDGEGDLYIVDEGNNHIIRFNQFYEMRGMRGSVTQKMSKIHKNNSLLRNVFIWNHPITQYSWSSLQETKGFRNSEPIKGSRRYQ